jgi:cell division protein FtsN
MARAAQKKSGSLFAGVMIGVVVGVVLAAGFALWSTDLNPFKKPSAAPEPKPAAAVIAPPAEPEAPPDLDFYRALPSGESLPAPTKPAPASPRYYLQAGAFKSAEDADNLKATLALLGVEAAIQTEEAADGALHRVRIGPIVAMDTLNRTRALLEQNHIPTMLVRVAPDKTEETP